MGCMLRIAVLTALFLLPGCAAPDSADAASLLAYDATALELCDTDSDASLRGLCAVSADVAWASGSGPAVLRTIDGGATWTNVAPESIAGLDVRDVVAWNERRAWIMTAGPGEASRILLTNDGGATWSERHRETAPEAFLDGLANWTAYDGIAYGDPMPDGRFRVLITRDGGETWEPQTTGPIPLEGGEASFAASGTGVRATDRVRAWIATGANDGVARVFASEDGGESWVAHETTITAAKPAAGAFSITFAPDGRGVAVGGDFQDRAKGGAHCASYTTDYGVTWHAPDVGTHGQRAGSAVLPNGWFLATGQTGTDVSRDGGRSWAPFSSEGFHCVDVAADGTVWFAGPNGRVARLR